MANISPLVIAAAVVVASVITGAMIFIFRNRRTFSGYSEIERDVKSLAERLDAELFRDGDDLVISGTYQKMPTIVRFSNSDNTPAVSIEARIPAAVQLTVTPKQLPDTAVGSKVKLPSRLDHKFTAKSKDPLEIEMLREPQSAVGVLTGLCCSQRTVLDITPGKLRLVEMIVPTSPLTHVINHLREIHDLSVAIQTLPGSETIKVMAIPRERSSWPLRAAIAMGVLIAAVSVMAATKDRSKPKPVAAAETTVHGMVPADAAVIPFAADWRTADSSEMQTAFVSWVSAFGLQASSRYEFATDDTGRPDGVAYLLANGNGAMRLVALVDHRVVFDSSFSHIAGAIRVPASAIPQIQWDTTKNVRQQNSGDGILLVRNADDPHSGVVLYLQDGTLRSASPVDYRSINLR